MLLAPHGQVPQEDAPQSEPKARDCEGALDIRRRGRPYNKHQAKEKHGRDEANGPPMPALLKMQLPSQLLVLARRRQLAAYPLRKPVVDASLGFVNAARVPEVMRQAIRCNGRDLLGWCPRGGVTFVFCPYSYLGREADAVGVADSWVAMNFG